jgi:hypothetical protein
VTPDELRSQSYQYVGTVGIVRDPEGVPTLRVAAINGGDAFCIGLQINDTFVERLPDQSWDALVARVRRDPALRGDPANVAIAIYPGVTPKPVSHRQMRRGR